MQFTSDVTVIDAVRDFVRDQAASSGFKDESVYSLQLAVVEAVTNVIVHAYEGELGHPIWLDVERDEGGLTFTLRDRGRGFDMKAHPDPDLKRHLAENIRGGLGVFLMRRLLDELELRRDGSCNVLRMRKRLDAPC
jgi:serine/threonine-protein kinase RsbW